MNAYVKNLFEIQNPITGDIPKYIQISNPSEFALFSFLQTLQLLKTENPFLYNTTINLDDMRQGNVNQISIDITNLINQYSYLGNIAFDLNQIDNILEINLKIVLAKEIFKNTYLEVRVVI